MKIILILKYTTRWENAAGLPIDAIYNENEKLNVPNYLMGNGNYFALNIIGDSMIDIGINEGDYCNNKTKNDAKDGDLVVSIDETETTLKGLKKMVKK